MKWLSMAARISAIAALGALFACTKSAPKPNTPEGALEAYVKIAFGAQKLEDAKQLLDLSTGEAYDWLSTMPKEAFEQQFVKNHMVLQSFSTKDLSQDKNGDVSLVYEIAFKDGAANGDPTHQAVYTNKKIAYLRKDGDQWKIKATKNVKSYIERKDPLEILGPEPKGGAEAPKPEAKGK